MATNSVGKVSVGIVANGAQAVAEFTRVESRAQAFGKKMQSVLGGSGGFGGAGKSLGLLGMGAATGGGALLAGGIMSGVSALTGGLTGLADAGIGAGVSAIKLAADYESANASLGVLFGNAQVGTKVLGDLTKLATETPYGSKDLIQTGKLLATFGATADQIIPIVSRLGDVSQGSADSLNRMALQFGQVLNAGVMQKDDFKVMVEAGADTPATMLRTRSRSRQSSTGHGSGRRADRTGVPEGCERSREESRRRPGGPSPWMVPRVPLGGEPHRSRASSKRHGWRTT